MLSKEHTQSGHSEYQDAILKAFDEAGDIALNAVEMPGSIVTVISRGRFGISHVQTEEDIKSEQGYCDMMNELLGRAYMFFFGSDIDGSDE